MRKLAIVFAVALFVAAAMALPLNAQNASGAIFTTLPNGSEVNYNIYAHKSDVYLDGGPGPGAPQSAAGLDDGDYVFMVTDPSGKTLLSTDAFKCRQFHIASGIITNVLGAGGCEHQTGTDLDHGAKTVQLCNVTGCADGFLDTPNPGGEYKVWVESLSCFQVVAGCSLDNVDCTASHTRHGFVHGCYKTDNFKVRGAVREIDTRFFPDYNGNGYKDGGEHWIDGLGITWHDTVGGSNKKWSYLNVALDINHEAHVEAPENGTHTFDILNQPGCLVGNIFVSGSALPHPGPQTVSVNVKPNFRSGTIFIDVACMQ